MEGGAGSWRKHCTWVKEAPVAAQKRTDEDSKDRYVGDLHALGGPSVRISGLSAER